MDRAKLRYGYLLAVLTLFAAVIPAAGCRSIVTFMAYMLKGTDAEADFKGLQGKKVAVVCRPMANLSFGNAAKAEADLARQVGTLLRQNISKIKIVDAQKVAEWTDQNDWSEYPEVGKAMGADMVVGIDLQEFKLYQGQTLYQGRASLMVTVYDCKEGGKVVYEKSVPRALYPPNTGIPTSDLPELEFRRKFVRVLADQIARHFYAHDAHADLNQDLDAL